MPVPLHGQISVTGSAQALTTPVGETTGFTIKAPLTNVSPVYIGGATVTLANGHQLDPGDVVTYERLSQNGQPMYQLRPSDFYAVGTSPDKVTWLASP